MVCLNTKRERGIASADDNKVLRGDLVGIIVIENTTRVYGIPLAMFASL
jgi:hypothetical protein